MSNDTGLLNAARALMDSVNFDMAGIDGRGGNGGLLSTATVRRSDELRQVILKYEAGQAPAAPSGTEPLLAPCR